MALNFFYGLFLFIASGAIWAMEDHTTQEAVPNVEAVPIIGAASYKIFFKGGRIIQHSRKKMNFVHLFKSNCEEDNSVCFYDKKNVLLRTEIYAGNIRGLECNDSKSNHSDCSVLNSYRSSSPCQIYEKRLDPKTKRTVKNFRFQTDDDEGEGAPKFITFYADKARKNNIAGRKLNFSDQSPDEINAQINSWRHFLNIDEKLADKIKEALIPGESDSEQEKSDRKSEESDSESEEFDSEPEESESTSEESDNNDCVIN